MTIATLGLAVDSRPVTTATAELNKLTAAAGPAAVAAAKLEKSAQGSSAAMIAAGKSAGLARHELINLSRQAQDVAVSLGSGQSFGTVLLQQGTQIGDVFASSGGTLRGFGSQLLSLVTPARAVAAGLVAAGAGAYFAFAGWKTFALQLDDTARRMGETSREAAKLQAAASFKGIDGEDFAKGMSRFSDQVYLAKNNMGGLAELARANGVAINGTSDALEKVADLVQRAGSEQQKYIILQQAGLPATAEWVRLLSQGAEGIRRAKAEAAEFGGAISDEMVSKARQFDETWNKFTTNFSIQWRTALTDTLGFFDRFGDGVSMVLMKIPGIGKNVPTNLLRSALNDVTGVSSSRLSGSSDVSNLYGKTGADRTSGLGARDKDRGSAVVDPDVLRTTLGLEQQRIGVLGQLATVQDAVRQKEIEITLARLSGVKVTESEAMRLRAYAAATALGTLAIRQQTEAQKIETGTIGLGVGATAAFRAEQERLADFRLRGIKLTGEQTAAIRKEAAALGEASQRSAEKRVADQLRFDSAQLGRTDTEQQVAATLRNLYGNDYKNQLDGAIAGQVRFNDTLRETKQFGESALSGLLRDFRDGKTGAEAFGSVLNKLQDKLFDIASNKIMSGLVGGGGDWLSKLIGGGASAGGGLGSASTGSNTGFSIGGAHEGAIVGSEATFARLFGGARKHHVGGMVGLNEVPIIAKRGEGVFTPGQMAKLAPVGSGNSGPIKINFIDQVGVKMEAKQSQGADGSTQIDMRIFTRMATDAVAADIRSREGPVHGAMKETFRMSEF